MEPMLQISKVVPPLLHVQLLPHTSALMALAALLLQIVLFLLHVPETRLAIHNIVAVTVLALNFLGIPFAQVPQRLVPQTSRSNAILITAHLQLIVVLQMQPIATHSRIQS
jgi:hypothetical protein